MTPIIRQRQGERTVESCKFIERRCDLMRISPVCGQFQCIVLSHEIMADSWAYRWLLYYHPIIAFLIFTPSFLISELLAAFSIWAFIAYRSSSSEPTSPPVTDTLDSSSSFSDDDDKDRIKMELDDDIFPVASTSRGGMRAGERMGATGTGGVLVRESEEEEEESSQAGSGSWEGVEEGEETEVERAQVKDEDDDTATIGGVSFPLPP